LKRQREEREAAEVRRSREAQLRRERAERERIRGTSWVLFLLNEIHAITLMFPPFIEAEASILRKQEKAQARQQEHRASVSLAALKAQEVLARRQATRSGVFESARKGDAAAVRKGVYENDVDASGGEILKGADMPESVPKNWDPKETLLHITVAKGDNALVEWLIDHSKLFTRP